MRYTVVVGAIVGDVGAGVQIAVVEATQERGIGLDGFVSQLS